VFFCALFYQMNKKFHLMTKAAASISSGLGISSQNRNLLRAPGKIINSFQKKRVTLYQVTLMAVPYIYGRLYGVLFRRTRLTPVADQRQVVTFYLLNQCGIIQLTLQPLT